MRKWRNSRVQVSLKKCFAQPFKRLHCFSKSNLASFSAGATKCCTKSRVRASAGFIPIRFNKQQFESNFFSDSEKSDPITPSHFTRKVDHEEEYPFPNAAFRLKSKNIVFYCDWQPLLFGIDEDEIPASEEEEMFEVDMEELREKALNLTEAEMAVLRKFDESKTDDELREAWIENNIPKYARRVRKKPVLERDFHEMFECICDIDLFYCRHYIPRFSEGVKEGEELKVPHFKAYWEEYRERRNQGDEDRWSAIIEKPAPNLEEQSDEVFRSIFNKSYNKDDVTRLRKKILASFRPLDCREIRRYRMPFAEALYLELQEDGHEEAASFFKYLIIKDYFVHKALANTDPTLRQSKGKLLKLIAFLKLADRYSLTQEFHKQATILLRTAKYYNEHEENWWWLAEEFYVRAVKVSQKSVIDGGKSEAVSRFMLGLYLLEYASRADLAHEHFSRAMELCVGKEWSLEKFLSQKQESLYTECVNHFCRVLIAQSQELRKEGKPNEALPLIHRSYKLCRESKTKRDIEMETYFELGMTYQEVGFMNWAKTAFRKFIEIAKEQNFQSRICDGYLEMAICYRSEGDLEKCHQNLLSYLHLATAKNDEHLIAFGHQYLGEFHLHNGNAAEAAECFQKAFTSFYKQVNEAAKIPYREWKFEHHTLIRELKLNRALLGLAQGELLKKPICQLILSAKSLKNQTELMKLINWKIKGEMDFEVKTEPDISSVSTEAWGALSYLSKTNFQVAVEDSDQDLIKTVRFATGDDEKPILL